MGRCTENGELKWLAITLYGSSFLRVVLKHYGYELDEGIVLVADNEVQARRIVQKYMSNLKNGYEVLSWKKRRKYPENYQCGFLNLNKTHFEAEIVEFLSEKDFLPVVVCGGIMPEYLRLSHFIFRIRHSDLTVISSDEFSYDIEQFENFVINHVPEVCKCLKELKSSMVVEEYKGEEDLKGIFTLFIGVAQIYALYLRQSKSERQVNEFVEDYCLELCARLNQMDGFASGNEIPQMLTDLVWDYLEKRCEIKVINENHLDEVHWRALQYQNVIVYDDKFYYFPPKLFMDICGPLLQNMSEPELKRKLKAEGMLYCNSADYTVKKLLTNVFGAKERVRFLWIRKNGLLSPDNLYLEDRFTNKEEKEELHW